MSVPVPWWSGPAPVLAAALVAGAVGCAPDDSDRQTAPGRPSEAAVAAARHQADEAATALTAGLYNELARATADNPPEAAVTVCGEVAQRLAAEATRGGIVVRRTTLRLRNTANAPDAYERRVLEEWARPGASAAPSTKVLQTDTGGWELRYLRPIILQPMCTTCHGDPGVMSAGVRRALLARYPDDQATGFRVGDVRGAVSVRVPLPAR